ncbi:MAG: T9SS type A sorting domain-containing protein [Crocinitomix sp.]|nr:T9SS type A sorting domain-containing protein [Crocinitomix sp.]
MKFGLSFIILLLAANSTWTQKVYIPDNNFELHLISLGLDDVLDDSVYTASIDTVLALHLNTLYIEDLEGIQGFSSLEFLECKNNILTELDVSDLTHLTQLSCELNYLTELNLDGIAALEWLFCDDNELTELDLSSHLELEYLLCGRNPIADLDVSLNDSLRYFEFRSVASVVEMDLSDKPLLHEVYCGFNNNLIYLNLANGVVDSFFILNAEDTPNLTCIEVDDPFFSETEWTNTFTEEKTFTTDCGLSISNETFAVLVNIYPIPAQNFINISVNQNNVNYTLIDVSGKVMRIGKLATGNNRIDIKDYHKGIYFLQLDGDDYKIVISCKVSQGC